MGPAAFIAMSLLCLAAIPVAAGLKRVSSVDDRQADDLVGR
jgi:hypothetical protein